MIEHNHLLINAKINKVVKDPEVLKQWLIEFVTKIGMKVAAGPISVYVDVPGNKGITGGVLIETSHIALHIWDEVSPALLQFDVYTCSCLPMEIVRTEIALFFDVQEYSYLLLDREKGFNIVESYNVERKKT